MKLQWLAHPRAARRIWIGFAALLALTVLAQWAVELTPHFPAESWFAFYALFGFAACAIMVAVSRLIGWLLKRRDDYYPDDAA